MFSTILGNFGKLNFWQKFDRRLPYKNSENFVLSLNELGKYFLALLFVPLIKRSVLYNFRHFLEIWIFDGNSTGADLTKIVKILYNLKMCYENIFWQNYLFPSLKEVFLHNFRQFFEIWIFDWNSTGANLTKIVKILYYLKMC